MSSMHLSLVVSGSAARQEKVVACRCQETCWELLSVKAECCCLWRSLRGLRCEQRHCGHQWQGPRRDKHSAACPCQGGVGRAACSQTQGVSGKAQ